MLWLKGRTINCWPPGVHELQVLAIARWNAAPSQELLVIRRNHKTGEVSLDPLRWGAELRGGAGKHELLDTIGW